MDCREFLDRYSDYDDSLMAPSEVDRFRAHMAACPACTRYDRVLRKGRMVARQLPRVEPRPDFGPRLQRRLLIQRQRGHRGRRAIVRGGLAAGLAAATVLMVAASAVQLVERLQPVRTAAEVSVPAVERAPRWARAAGERFPLVVPPQLALVSSYEPRVWTVKKVAPAGAGEYSPLETGPPAYRVAASSSANTTHSDRRALD